MPETPTEAPNIDLPGVSAPDISSRKPHRLSARLRSCLVMCSGVAGLRRLCCVKAERDALRESRGVGSVDAKADDAKIPDDELERV